MAFFLVGAVHVALMFMVLKVASSMVAGWQVFGLAKPDVTVDRALDTARMGPRQIPGAPPLSPAANAPAQGEASAQRRVDIALATASAANDTGPAAHSTTRETRVYATNSANAHSANNSVAASRTRGIGNRFRSANTARKTEIR